MREQLTRANSSVGRIMVAIAAALLFSTTTAAAQQPSGPAPSVAKGNQDDSQIAALHRELRDLKTKVEAQQTSLESISDRFNLIFGISGAILTIFLGALANKVVNHLFQDSGSRRKSSSHEEEFEESEEPAPEIRRRHPHRSLA